MGRRKKGQHISGWVNLDKPLELGSTQAVSRVRRIFDAQKAGHAGTLDPLATGILPIALGEATKTVPFLVDRDKVYRFGVKWGEARSTDDREGEVIATSDTRPSEAQIAEALKYFEGEIMQVPPKFSAVKIDGERAYDIARDGGEVELKPRPVTVYEAKLLGCPDEDTCELEVECSKGTYVRSIARDLGQKLGTVAHVSWLRRTRVGPFTEETAISLDKLDALGNSAAHFEALAPVETVLDDIPALAVTGDQAQKLRQGRTIIVPPGVLPLPPDTPASIQLGAEHEWGDEDEGDLVYAMDRERLVALGFVSRGAFHPTRVFRI